MDFFSILTFSSKRYPLYIQECSGVQWVLPDYRRSVGSDCIVIDQSSFKVDFLNLGKSLFTLMPDNYWPGQYRHMLDIVTMGSGDHMAFLNEQFRGIQGGDLLVDFFEKYGLPSTTDEFCNDFSGGEKHDILAKYAHDCIPEYGTCSKIQFSPAGLEWPTAVLADFIIEIFLLSTRPEEITRRIKNNFRQLVRTTNLSYTATFRIGQSGYEQSCHISSMFDYAALLILHDPHTVVRECPNCKRVFLPSNLRAQKYCSHSCQNSAASKRSQAKRAAEKKVENNG